MAIKNAKIKKAGAYTKELLTYLFWLIILASILVPHSLDSWLPAGFSQ